MARRRLWLRLWVLLEWTLALGGGVCLGVWTWMVLNTSYQQSVAQSEVTRVLEARPTPADRIRKADKAPKPARHLAEHDVVGRLTIPRLHLSAPVLEGDTVLGYAISHLSETPTPWEFGNSALAAHRDGLFRPLKDVRIGDKISLSTPEGDFHYRVRHTLIVEPREVWVLGAVPDVGLTLITCFPFYYVGHAPQRFIVQAEKLDSESANADDTF